MNASTGPQAGRLLMGLYPAAYRAAHGADIEAVFAETTEGLTRRQVLRERGDLARHALRLRLRIGPTNPAGRVLAGAAPVVVAAGAGYALHLLLPVLSELVEHFRNPHPVHGLRPALAAAVSALPTLPWLLALVLAVQSRWRAARICGVLGTLADAATLLLLGSTPLLLLGEALGMALGALVLVLAPTALVDVGRRGKWEVTGLALGIALPLIAADRIAALSPDGNAYLRYLCLPPAWACTVTAVAVLLRLSTHRPDLLRSAGTALGAAPRLLFILFLTLDQTTSPRFALQLAALLLAPFAITLTLALTIHLIRRARRTVGPA
ncbi:hypothetical protein ACF9IK_02190 [Kitasatospora hibisci]|uniref:hypothetical protein n=1 Tax=Kitasatospora hibisci TaxID=3369522 RepID=UPI0037546C5A